MDLDKLMLDCLELASKGLRKVAPNPMVAALLVKDNEVIAKGYHEFFGGPHAEVNAFSSAKDQDLSDATLICNLEPCCHFGKTPPCTKLILEKKIKNIVIATEDPNPMVAGKGIKELQAHGVNVISGVAINAAKKLNHRYFTFHLEKRPYIIIKFAQTKNGFIAKSNYDSKWISGEKSRTLVHTWRSQEQGILVGSRTAIYDNPELTVRHVEGINPIRILIDPKLKVPEQHEIYNDAAQSLIFNSIKSETIRNLNYIKLNHSENFVNEILKQLYERGISSLIIEGGANTIDSFVKLRLWDQARIFTSNKLFENGIKAPEVKGTIDSIEFIGDDRLEIISNNLLDA